jgi:hypothetical protein
MIRPRPVAAALGVLLLSLAVGRVLLADDPPRAAAAPTWLGPLAPLLAHWQWVRVELAFARGDAAGAVGRAAWALELDPADTDGWALLLWYLGVQLTSAEREPDGERRLAWLRAALELVDRGLDQVRDPGLLQRRAAEVLWLQAEVELPLPWPGGRRGLWREAERRFAAARDLGDPLAEFGRRAAQAALEAGIR